MRGEHASRTSRARVLRGAPTDAERKLWYRLNNRQLAGHKFVRQEPVGPYFADFACREAQLVVEVDGSQHAESDATAFATPSSQSAATASYALEP